MWHVCPAKTQISLGIRPVWPESSLFAWRKLGSLATHWAHSEDSDQTGQMPRLIWVFAGRIRLKCNDIKFCVVTQTDTTENCLHSNSITDVISCNTEIIKQVEEKENMKLCQASNHFSSTSLIKFNNAGARMQDSIYKYKTNIAFNPQFWNDFVNISPY